MQGHLSLHDGSPLGDSSPSDCACSDTNGLRHKAQHQHQHIWLVLTHNVGLFNVIFNNVVNGLNVNIWGLSLTHNVGIFNVIFNYVVNG